MLLPMRGLHFSFQSSLLLKKCEDLDCPLFHIKGTSRGSKYNERKSTNKFTSAESSNQTHAQAPPSAGIKNPIPQDVVNDDFLDKNAPLEVIKCKNAKMCG